MPEISDLIEQYKKECKKMVPPDQAELVDTIIDLGLKIGASMAHNLQAVQGTDTEFIQLPPEDDDGAPYTRTDYPTKDAPIQPVKCRRHCVQSYKGECMIFNEGEICPDTHLCECYEKYEGRNQWGV